MTEVTLTGFYKGCVVCQAPVLITNGRQPEGWTVTVSRVGLSTFFTPHRPDCARPREERHPPKVVLHFELHDADANLLSLLLGEPT